MTADVDGLVAQGRAALTGCDWAAARACFEEALAIAETPEALDGLGQARYWQHAYAEALGLRERAYALYRQRADHAPAAVVAIQLAMLYGLIYGNEAAMSGWVGHAERMLAHAGDCPERGWVELVLAGATADPEERERRARAACEIGQRFADPDLEYDALGYVGLALVERAEVEAGMRLIDEALAVVTSGVVTDPWSAGELYCTLFAASELVGDVKRAEAWLGTVDRYVSRTGELPVSGLCRMKYGALLTVAGRWTEAERELLDALSIYDTSYQVTRYEPVVRLADLRVRQGRLEEAEQLLRGYEDLAEAAQPRIRLLLVRGEPGLAEVVAERYLTRRGRGVPSAAVLGLLVEAKLALGKHEEARALADELAELAAACPQTAVRGLGALARARVAVAGDEDAAVASFEEAVEAFAEAELRYDLGCARLGLATVLAGTNPEVARSEAKAALACFEELKAARNADAAASLLRRLGDRGRSWPKGFGTLTKRETEVLGLLGEGCSNADIANRLFISPRTAEHHVGNILSKLGLGSRAEAAAYAVRVRQPGEGHQATFGTDVHARAPDRGEWQRR